MTNFRLQIRMLANSDRRFPSLTRSRVGLPKWRKACPPTGTLGRYRAGTLSGRYIRVIISPRLVAM
jgi:hypothetical protein